MRLRRLAGMVRPTMWVTAERVFAEVFALALFAVQARLLGPAAFGLVAAVMVFVTFWDSVPNQAAVEALVSVRAIEDRHYFAGATAMVLLSLAFGAVIFACAGPLATLFADAELAPIMRAMAVLPLLQSFSVIPLAVTRREIKFQTTTLRTIVSLVAGGAVGLVLALTGAGVWALVWQALVQRLVATVILWSAVKVKFRVSLSTLHVRDLAGFAVPVMLSNVMNWGSGQFPRLILGAYLGPADLGLFTTAGRFNAMVKQIAIAPKAFVARVDLRRFATDPAALDPAIRRVFLQLSLLSFPISLGGAAIMPPLFHVWLDARWYAAILPTQILLLACVPYVTFYGTTAVLYALNLQAWEAGVATMLNLSVLAGMAAAMTFGLVAVTVASAAVPLLLMPLPLLALRRGGHVSPRAILTPQVLPLIAATAMAGAVLWLRAALAPHVSEAAALPLVIGAGAVLYPALVALLIPRALAQFRGA